MVVFAYVRRRLGNYCSHQAGKGSFAHQRQRDYLPLEQSPVESLPTLEARRLPGSARSLGALIGASIHSLPSLRCTSLQRCLLDCLVNGANEEEKTRNSRDGWAAHSASDADCLAWKYGEDLHCTMALKAWSRLELRGMQSRRPVPVIEGKSPRSSISSFNQRIQRSIQFRTICFYISCMVHGHFTGIVPTPTQGPVWVLYKRDRYIRTSRRQDLVKY